MRSSMASGRAEVKSSPEIRAGNWVAKEPGQLDNLRLEGVELGTTLYASDFNGMYAQLDLPHQVNESVELRADDHPRLGRRHKYWHLVRRLV